ncbi:MAG: TrmH family RNA methyltransferase [Treponema sp.]|nr:TrmH family RNA methyltransferase [Treponema sp.]
MAEKRLKMSTHTGIFTSSELTFFTDAAKMLSNDALFSQDAQKAFLEAANVFGNCDSSLFLRFINRIKHILLAETGRDQADWDFTGIDGKLDPEKRQIFEGMWVYLEDIRSPFNVGAMFRTAESFGVEKIILSSFCADPRHRRAERTAMGCIDVVSWERSELFVKPEVPMDTSIPIFALETCGIPLEEFSFPKRGLLIAGSEELGVSPQALAAADISLGRVSIPCYGTKASLNVSVAFGIAIQKWASVMDLK